MWLELHKNKSSGTIECPQGYKYAFEVDEFCTGLWQFSKNAHAIRSWDAFLGKGYTLHGYSIFKDSASCKCLFVERADRLEAVNVYYLKPATGSWCVADVRVAGSFPGHIGRFGLESILTDEEGTLMAYAAYPNDTKTYVTYFTRVEVDASILESMRQQIGMYQACH